MILPRVVRNSLFQNTAYFLADAAALVSARIRIGGSACMILGILFVNHAIHDGLITLP